MEKLAEATRHYFGLELSRASLESFRRYRDEIIVWNRQAGLTALRMPEEIERVLFMESLALITALPHLSPTAERLLDVGSGAGIPGLPLKLAIPSLNVTLLEARGKKLRFLDHAIRSLEIDGVEILAGRAEDLAHNSGHREAYSVVTARALAPMPILAEFCLPFVKLGGAVVALKGRNAPVEVERGRQAIQLLGGEVQDVRRVDLPKDSSALFLVVLQKVGPTSPAYPRRPGVPKKRPLP